MNIAAKIAAWIKDPKLIILTLGFHNLLNWIPDKAYLKMVYRFQTGQKLNIDNPQGFNEKLQWLKLYDRKSEYTQMVDKYGVRELIRERIGEDYLIPLLGVWDRPEDIDISALPEQFVLKCTHDSGSICICRDKAAFDMDAAVKKLRHRLKIGTYWPLREWPYKNVTPRVIAEKYMEDESGELKDYKVLCFGGEPKLIEVHSGRYTSAHTQDLYSPAWEKLDMAQDPELTSDFVCPKPDCLAEMLENSRKLAENIPMIRVDWYIINGRLYFGELTFFHGSGMDLFDDPQVERTVGSWINLPEKTVTK